MPLSKRWNQNMNDIIESQKHLVTAGTLAIFSVAAAVVIGPINWPDSETPVYNVPQISSSYSSFVDTSLSFAPNLSLSSFEQEVVEIFENLSENQELLGVEFEAVWDSNVDSLYEA